MKNEFLKVFAEPKVKLTWAQFDDACRAVLEFINQIDATHTDLSLLGMARGALPFLVKMSHLAGIRDISIVHSELTKSENPHDYADAARIVFEYIRENKSDFIILEDIIVSGRSINTAIDLLKSHGKNIVGIAAIALPADFSPADLSAQNIPIFSAFQIPAGGWIDFPWES